MSTIEWFKDGIIVDGALTSTVSENTLIITIMFDTWIQKHLIYMSVLFSRRCYQTEREWPHGVFWRYIQWIQTRDEISPVWPQTWPPRWGRRPPSLSTSTVSVPVCIVHLLLPFIQAKCPDNYSLSRFQDPPTVILSIEPRSVLEGERVKFTCQATANPPIMGFRSVCLMWVYMLFSMIWSQLCVKYAFVFVLGGLRVVWF